MRRRRMRMRMRRRRRFNVGRMPVLNTPPVRPVRQEASRASTLKVSRAPWCVRDFVLNNPQIAFTVTP